MNVNQVISKIVGICKNYSAKQVILFGSRAKETALERSDIAVAGVHNFLPRSSAALGIFSKKQMHFLWKNSGIKGLAEYNWYCIIIPTGRTDYFFETIGINIRHQS